VPAALKFVEVVDAFDLKSHIETIERAISLKALHW
jgi:hypothetical protein